MKKFVKPLIIAASVAAVAGIGAVSFAKWTSDNSATTTGSATTGSISVTNGFFKEENGDLKTMSLITADADKVLVPTDQPDNTVTNGQKTLTFNIPDYQIDGSYTLSLGVVAKKGESTVSLSDGAKVQYKVNGTNFIDAGTAETTTVSGTDVATETGNQLVIQLVSNNLNDMGLTLELTLTYADVA